MDAVAFDRRVASVREFNRLYTQRIGILDERLLASPFTLAEARVLYELAHRERPIARQLAAALGLDAGYLSRILRGFQRRGLVERRASPADRRRHELILTAAGKAAMAQLDGRSRQSIGAMLAPLAEDAQARLVSGMQTIAGLLALPAGLPTPGTCYRLRAHQPGDIGWIASRHGALYAEEYGFDMRFEALVAEIAAGFINRFDPRCERCWIAESAGQPVGSVLLVKQSDSTAQLRLLLVEPAARGLGIGHRLVAECIGFARETGYRRLTLWTQSTLLAARRIYRSAGFRLVHQAPHHSFGQDLIGENWELVL